MKFAIRAFVIALALTGVVATTHTNSFSAAAQTSVSSVSLSKSSAMPPPTCPPSDPNDCGM